MSQFIGTVGALWRYPVKSMLGESCTSYQIETRGVEGDRLYAVRNGAGKFGSGKTTRRFTQLEGLFNFRTYYRDGTPIVVFPDGVERAGLQSETDHALSQIFAQPVTLSREEGISHFDDGPIHLVTSAALTSLRNALSDPQIDERRFRPNLLLNVEGHEPVEHGWVGRQLRIGAEVILEISGLTERCAMTTFPQAELQRQPHLLKHLSNVYNLHLGVYAKVLKEGSVRVDDPVELI